MPWITNANVDVAATLMPILEGDIRTIPENLFEDFGNLRVGDDIFFMGFPLCLGVAPPEAISPIVRAGIIAAKHADGSFLIDANVFPGNSGSPVFFRPCPFQIGDDGNFNLGNVRPPKLVGILTSIIPYRDEAVSRQTGMTRVVFEENSGLAPALAIEHMREIINSDNFIAACRTTIERSRARHP